MAASERAFATASFRVALCHGAIWTAGRPSSISAFGTCRAQPRICRRRATSLALAVAAVATVNGSLCPPLSTASTSASTTTATLQAQHFCCSYGCSDVVDAASDCHVSAQQLALLLQPERVLAAATLNRRFERTACVLAEAACQRYSSFNVKSTSASTSTSTSASASAPEGSTQRSSSRSNGQSSGRARKQSSSSFSSTPSPVWCARASLAAYASIRRLPAVGQGSCAPHATATPLPLLISCCSLRCSRPAALLLPLHSSRDAADTALLLVGVWQALRLAVAVGDLLCAVLAAPPMLHTALGSALQQFEPSTCSTAVHGEAAAAMCCRMRPWSARLSLRAATPAQPTPTALPCDPAASEPCLRCAGAPLSPTSAAPRREPQSRPRPRLPTTTTTWTALRR